MKPRKSKVIWSETETESVPLPGETTLRRRAVMHMPDGTVRTGSWWWNNRSRDAEATRLRREADAMWKEMYS